MFPMPYPHIVDKNGEKTLKFQMSFKKIFYKILNNQKYKELKYLEEDKNKIQQFKNIFERR